jgi:hypothetical protein
MMKAALARKSTVIALAVGIIVGMLVRVTKTRAQIQTPFGPQPAPSAPNCEQYFRAAFGTVYPDPSYNGTQALLYLACREHAR